MSESLDMHEPQQRKVSKKPALGRGLGSLLGESSHEVTIPIELNETELAPKVEFHNDSLNKVHSTGDLTYQDQSKIWQLDIEKIAPNKKQPRKIFAPEALKDLANSIKEKGILQPIVVRKVEGKETTALDTFEIIAGERRWRAAQLAGLHYVPVIIKKTQDQEALELALIENIQRENLNPIEEAEAYQYLLQQYSLTQQSLADKLGKDRATIANTLRLLGLNKEVRQLLSDQKISMGHAKVLLAVADPLQQQKLAQQVVLKKMSVRELERLVAKALAERSRGKDLISNKAHEESKAVEQIGEELQKIMGTKVVIDYLHGKGQINIHFFSESELNGIVERIRESWGQ
ncbi:MAG: ParB/RepB/Spo0J family partition protein [Bdellovibrionales bacterium]|nr:ParB/RepB/Spo0J family partition protein [Bdellovibrionales bacterium]